MPEILIVGAGPVGLTMALELARHGKRCRIIDKLPEPLPFCRAIGITPRTLEVWEDMGIVRDMIEAGIWFTGLHAITPDGAKDLVEDLSDLPYATFGLPQYSTEEVLAHHLSRAGIEIERGASLTSLTQDDDSVSVTIEHADGRKEAAEFRYIVGCDGAHSFVRKAVGIAFEGEDFRSTSCLETWKSTGISLAGRPCSPSARNLAKRRICSWRFPCPNKTATASR